MLVLRKYIGRSIDDFFSDDGTISDLNGVIVYHPVLGLRTIRIGKRGQIEAWGTSKLSDVISKRNYNDNEIRGLFIRSHPD